jgi:acyl transferase domain-containing protein/thioesterase domain-containing protein
MDNESKLRDYLKRVTLELHKTRATLDAREQAASEPIAIIGAACRYPGSVDTPEALWRLLGAGADGIGDAPSDRGWDLVKLAESLPGGSVKGKLQGGFVRDVADFDADFFGISPREALATDPQQRLLLETAWEALERAGVVPSSLSGSAAGVFVGLSQSGYGAFDAGPELQGYALTGSSSSVASGRIAYTLGWQGPTLTVDTACSSSLVALHLACSSLRRGESILALAGGAAVIATPAVYTVMGAQGGLAADGRCKSFSSTADGVGWSEGAGMLVLERLSDALRNKRQILALVRGSAINQDGRSQGLMAPNGPAQQQVIWQALASAGLAPHEIDAVEAHGTGTKLGDPIEAQALLATYGRERSDEQPLWLGSLKSNLGHSQAAAGVGGILKLVLALQNGTLPKTLHVEAPTPHVDWKTGAVRLLERALPWPETGRPRRAAVSSFGVSGTNAHVILEQAPAGERRPAASALEPLPFVLSAVSEQALGAQAAALLAHLEEHTELSLRDVSYTLACARTHFAERAVVVADEPVALRCALQALASGQHTAVSGRALGAEGGRVVFVFPGQGAHWVGMAQELLETEPVFAAQLHACARALSELVSWSLLEVLREADGRSLEQVDVLQPTMFAIVVSLAAVWQARGVRPAAVVGHSQGEIAAAYVAGAISLSDALKVVVLRSEGLHTLRGRGAMSVLELPAAAVSARLVRFEGQLSIAAINSPSGTVVSGTPEAMAELLSELERESVLTRRVRCHDIAGHSAQVDAFVDTLRSGLRELEAQATSVPLYSTVEPRVLAGSQLDLDHWVRNVRDTVHFSAAIELLLADGYRHFVELSPHPVLIQAIAHTAEGVGVEVAAVGSLRRDQGGRQRLQESLAELHVRGGAIDFASWFAHSEARLCELPTYAFQRQRYWLDQGGARVAQAGQTSDESAFWAALASGDGEALASTLSLRGEPEREAAGKLAPALAAFHARTHAETRIDGFRYQIEWRRQSHGAPVDLRGRWLLLHGEHGSELARALSEVMTRRGAELVLCQPDALDRETLTSSLRGLVDGAAWRGIVSLLAVEPGECARVPLATAATLWALQALEQIGFEAPRWLITRGAIASGAGERVSAPEQALVWGLGRVLGLEQPARWGGLIDLEADQLTRKSLERCASALGGHALEDQLAIRAGRALVARMVHAPRKASVSGSFRPRGAVLVTGGTGGIGAQLARWLAREGASHLVLTSRRGIAAEGAAALQEELLALGVQVTIAAADVADREALARVVESAEAHAGPIRAVFHAAGVGSRNKLEHVELAELSYNLDSKVRGARHLHELFQERTLDAFVLFASGAGVWGSSAQSAYSAANAFLDAFAHYRCGQGLVATSVSWGMWEGPGMAELVAEFGRRWGMLPLPPELALTALAQALHDGDTALTVSSFDWDKFAPQYALARERPLLREIPEARAALAPPESSATGEGLSAQLVGLDDVGRSAVLLREVQKAVGKVLRAEPDQVDPRRKLVELGLDSLMAVELRNQLARMTRLALPATLIFEHGTPALLVSYLAARLSTSSAAAGAEAEPTPLLSMTRQLVGAGEQALAWQLIDVNTRLRLAQSDTPPGSAAPRVHELASTGSNLRLICFPAIIPPYGPNQFLRLANALRGVHDLSVLCVPGYARGEALLEDFERLLHTLAPAVLDCAAGGEFALLGYSSGGYIAHALTKFLERQGLAPKATVLLESHLWESDSFDINPNNQMPRWREFFPLPDGKHFKELGEPSCDEELSAMAHYMTFFQNGWSPRALSTPTLLVASELDFALPRMAAPVAPVRRWYEQHDMITVAGDHLTFMTDHADSTARALSLWLAQASAAVPASMSSPSRTDRLQSIEPLAT